MNDIQKIIETAFNFGVTYWSQADSESHKQNKKAAETMEKYNKFKNECITAADKVER